MDDNTQDPEVVEAEIVTTSSSNDDSTVLLSLEEMIKSNIASLETLREEMRKIREMFEDTFSGDPLYIEKAEEAKKAAKGKSEVRARIMQQPSVKEMADKIKHIRSEVAERSGALSDYLQEYQRISGLTQLEVDGQMHQIVNSSKVVKAQ
jgi:DNA-binding ferritin-like protein